MDAVAYKLLVAERSNMLLRDPFWGMLALRLRLQEDPYCRTAWTDGVTVGYNPEFVRQQTPAKLRGLLAHETGHAADGHQWRRDGRDPDRWNVACDYALNTVLLDAGYELPDHALVDWDLRGKSPEWIYPRHTQPQEQDPPPPQPGEGDGDEGAPQEGGPAGAGGPGEPDADDDGQPDGGGMGDDGQPDGAGMGEQGDADGQDMAPGQWGEVRDAPPDAEAEATRSDWEQAVRQAAAVAKARGTLPAGVERWAEEVCRSRVDWASTLRRFVQQVAKADYSWQRPSRRYLGIGLYIPSLRSEAMGPMAIVRDTSASIDAVTLAQFHEEIAAVIDEVRPQQVHVIDCDAAVHQHTVLENGDTIEFLPPAKGGGGTAFEPAFEFIEELDEEPVCVVYLTDLMGSFPEPAPDVPTLWLNTYRREAEAPFGETIYMGD